MENARTKVSLLESFKSALLSKISHRGDAIIRGNTDDEAQASRAIEKILKDASKVLSMIEYQELFKYKEEILEPGEQKMIIESPIKEANYRKARGRLLRKLNPGL